MKKFTKVLLSAALAASMVVPATLSVSAAELTTTDGTYGNAVNTGCGFLDGNLYVSEGFAGDSIADISVSVNGNPAYFNLGYLGAKHCGLGTDFVDNAPANGWLQVGVVGADLVKDAEATIVVTDKDGNTLTQKFTPTVNALGTSYAKVTGDAKAKTMKAEFVFNTDPGFEIGTTLNAKCHDDHGPSENPFKGTFTVTAYDEATKMYTLESTDFVTTQSLLELQVSSEGDYKDYWVSATINEYNAKVADSGVIGTKVAITEIAANRGTAANLNDGTNSKLESNTPPSADNPIVVTFKTAEAFKLNTLVLYTGNDDADWPNRAPKAFKLYGVAADGTEAVLFETAEAGMENKNYTPYAYNVDATVAYDSYKLEITEGLGGYFQFGEVVIYSDDAVISDEPIYELKSGAVEYNGTEPKAPEQGGNEEQPPVSGGEEQKPPKTGDALTVMIVVSAVAMAAIAVVVSKKRNAAC